MKRNAAPRLQYIPPEWKDIHTGDREELDKDHVIQRLYDSEGLFGFIENHRRDKDTWCSGYVAWRPVRVWEVSGHQLVSEDRSRSHRLWAVETAPAMATSAEVVGSRPDLVLQIAPVCFGRRGRFRHAWTVCFAGRPVFG